MATKISDLPAATTPVGAQFCIIQDAATKRLPTTALVGAAPATPGTVPLYDASGRLIVNGIQGYDVDAHVSVDLIARGLQSRDDRSGYPGTRLLFEASGVEDETIFDVVIPAAKAGTVAMTSDIPTYASQAEAEAGTATTKIMSPLRVAEAIAALAGSGVTEATSGEAKAGAGSTQLMTPRRVAEARRVVDRLLITEDVFLGGSWWLMINASRANRIITRVSLALTGLTLGSMPVPIVYLSRYTLLPRDTSPDPAWAISGGLTDVGIGDWTDTALSKDGLSFAWDAGVRIKMAFQANWGPYDVLSSTTGAEVEVEWRAA